MELRPRRLEKTIEALKKLKKKKEKQWDKKRGGQGERESVRCYSYIKRCKEVIGISVLLHYHSFSQLSSLSATNSDLFF